MKEKFLFRKEVIENKKNKHYGSVSINLLPGYTALTIGFTSLTILILLFLTFAEFSEKHTVSGYLNSKKAFSMVYPKMSGMIVKSYFQQGDRVVKGDKLFLIDTSYAGLSMPHEHEMGDQLQKSKVLIEKEIVYKTQHLDALKQLLKQKYVSLMDYHSKKEELLELENKKNSLEMDIIKYNQTRSYLIRSPIDGIIASVMFKQGQHAQESTPLIKIIPEDAELVAELFVPVKKAGFLKKNSQVIIRYDAYPYERFGTYLATIKAVSQSIMTDEEEDKPIKVGEPYYKVTAQLTKQSVSLYGKKKKIQNGMTLSAVIVGSKRKIWQWILDPLYSYYGTLIL